MPTALDSDHCRQLAAEPGSEWVRLGLDPLIYHWLTAPVTYLLDRLTLVARPLIKHVLPLVQILPCSQQRADLMEVRLVELQTSFQPGFCSPVLPFSAVEPSCKPCPATAW